MTLEDHRRSCICGHRYNVHAKNGGPCLAADTPPGQRTGQGCQCHAWNVWDEPQEDQPPTPEDQAVWEQVYGFTPHEIGIMARAVEVPEDKVTRLIELSRFIRTLPKPEVAA